MFNDHRSLKFNHRPLGYTLHARPSFSSVFILFLDFVRARAGMITLKSSGATPLPRRQCAPPYNRPRSSQSDINRRSSISYSEVVTRLMSRFEFTDDPFAFRYSYYTCSPTMSLFREIRTGIKWSADSVKILLKLMKQPESQMCRH